MQRKEQITMTADEVKKALADHLRREGARINETTIEIRNDDSLFALTLTEEEAYLVDTKIILRKPISMLEIKNSRLMKKLKNKYPNENIGKLLSKIPGDSKKDFLENLNLSFGLLSNSGGRRKDRLTDKEEETLINVFSELGIKVAKS